MVPSGVTRGPVSDPALQGGTVSWERKIIQQIKRTLYSLYPKAPSIWIMNFCFDGAGTMQENTVHEKRFDYRKSAFAESGHPGTEKIVVIKCVPCGAVAWKHYNPGSDIYLYVGWIFDIIPKWLTIVYNDNHQPQRLTDWDKGLTDGVEITSCYCIINGTGAGSNNLRWDFTESEKVIRYPLWVIIIHYVINDKGSVSLQVHFNRVDKTLN